MSQVRLESLAIGDLELGYAEAYFAYPPSV
jgi:hypothetical protein